MSTILHVEKLGKAIILTYDGKKLKIEGDSDNHRKKGSRSSRSCVCVPNGGTSSTNPTVVPVSNTNILFAMYNVRTNMIQLHALVADQPTDPESKLELYKFMYTVKDNEKEKAIEFCQIIMDSVYQGLIAEKRLKILVNPFGGQSKAKDIFENQVKPIFEAAKCKLDIQFTEHQGHALEIARDMDINNYDAIVTVSGDGVIHEIINGFLQRPDARDAIKKVSLGIIPGGTSNSLSISMLGEKLGFDPVHTSLQVIKGRSLAMDICSVTYDDRRYFSFLSHSFGIAAYADLGTEHMRWMGDTRTVVGLLQEIFSNKTYKMEASLLIAESEKSKMKENCRSNLRASVWKDVSSETGAVVDTIPPLSDPVPENWTTINDDISFFLTSKVPLLNRGMLCHPCASPNDGLIDLLMVRGGKGITKQLGVFTSIENGKHMDMDIVEYYKVKAFRLKPIVKPGKNAYVAIDGEHAPVKPFQVEVHPCLGSVLSLNPTYINTHV